MLALGCERVSLNLELSLYLYHDEIEMIEINPSANILYWHLKSMKMWYKWADKSTQIELEPVHIAVDSYSRTAKHFLHRNPSFLYCIYSFPISDNVVLVVLQYTTQATYCYAREGVSENMFHL